MTFCVNHDDDAFKAIPGGNLCRSCLAMIRKHEPIEIALTLEQRALARTWRTLRIAESAQQGLKYDRSVVRDLLTRHRNEDVGALGEIAVSVAYGHEISPDGKVNTFHGPPDAGDVEVRSTELENGCLIIRDNDLRELSDRVFYLTVVNLETGVVSIRGWLKCSDAPGVGTVKDPGEIRPSIFVEQAYLHAPPPVVKGEDA